MAHPAWGLSTSTPPWCQAAGANTRFAWGTLGQSDTPLPSAPPSHSPQPTRLPSCRASVRWEAFTLSHVSFQRSGTCPSSISRLCSSCGGIQASAQEGTRPQGPLSLSRGVQPTATLVTTLSHCVHGAVSHPWAHHSESRPGPNPEATCKTVPPPAALTSSSLEMASGSTRLRLS